MNEVFEAVIESVRRQFPRYRVQHEGVFDAPQTIQVAVYGVPGWLRDEITEFIHDLDWNLCQPHKLAAIARVVDQATTFRHYPEYAPSPIFAGAACVVDLDMGTWAGYSHSVAANAELAHAA